MSSRFSFPNAAQCLELEDTAAKRTTTGTLIPVFTATECANFFAAAGYEPG